MPSREHRPLEEGVLKAGLPVISMDTKKKELLGNFYREGKIDTGNDRDQRPRLRQCGGGHGDPPQPLRCGENKGSSTSIPATTPANWPVTVSRRGGRRKAGPTIPRQETTAVMRWRRQHSATCIVKEDLQKLADRLASRSRATTAYCSKWNPIEHRLSHLTGACRGVIYHTLETVRYTWRRPKRRRAKVKVSILTRCTRRAEVCAGFKKTMKIVFDEFLPKWNYRAVPQSV